MADEQAHDWITLHRLDFDRPLTKDEIVRSDLPGASITRTCIGYEITPEGSLSASSASWGVLGVFPDEASARAVFDAPEAAIPAMADTVSAWHGLAIPLSHRGTVNWRGEEETDSALRCGKAEGPLMVVTSAGFRSPPEPERGARFARGVQAVLDFYGTLPGNRARGAFNGNSVDARNGFTLSFWSDTPSMIAAAYKDGEHKRQLDIHAETPLLDYSSFTRLALQAGKGTWDGAEIAA